MQPLVLCSFCHKSFPEQELHDCVTKTYTLLNTLAQETKDQSTLFQNIDNVVLQGGGIKGISYLGVLDTLLEENPDFLKNLKRVAGNSAGSIAALYIALGLDPKTDMADLMNKNYLDLLDDGLVLKVAYNIKSWFGDYKYKNFTAKDIFTAGINGFDYLQSLMKQPKGPQQVEQIATEMFTNILQYYSSKFGSAYSVFMRAGAPSFADYATKWLLSILKPTPSNKSPQTASGRILNEVALIHPDNTDNTYNGDNTDNTEYNPEIPNFEDVIKDAFQRVAHDQSVISIDKDVDAVENIIKTGFSDVKDLADVQKEDTQFYKSQTQQPVSDIADKSELTGALLHYSLAELLWFVIISQVDADGMKEQLGLFAGDIVKKELIENSIQIAFKNLNKVNEYKLGLTFKELDAVVDSQGKKAFKPIFCTSFNTANLRTEVFSVYHTPNVIVSDAIRASMSIPIFFTPVTIRENDTVRQIYYNGGKSSEAIRYMDGGVLDNYPLWIFDDLKYCLDDIPGWVPDRKIFIQNPRTLGFRLMQDRIIDIYTNPYYDPQRTKMKRVGTGDYKGTFGFIMGSFLQANVNKHEENEHIYRGDCPRSVYVDNLGISTFAFNLPPEDKEKLIQSGRQAIINYKIRAKTDFFGEGENYH